MDTSSLLPELLRALGRIEGKQDQFLENHSRLRFDHDKLASKVSAVESKLHWLAGVSATVGATAFLFKDKLLSLLWG
jgi:hypothetical protein